MKKHYILLMFLLPMTSKVFSQWSLSGNSISSGDYLGTTNAQSLLFKVNSTMAGYLDVTTQQNTFFGVGAGGATSASQNTAFGYNALNANSTGNSNVAVGIAPLALNTTGYGNVAIGWKSLGTNTIGMGNVAIGGNALWGNKSGRYNIAIGQAALWVNSVGEFNVALGSNSLFQSVTGNYNVGLGYYALFANYSGSANVALGLYALQYNVTGNNNTAVGYQAGPASGTSYTDLSNTSAIGNGATVTASNQIVIGNSSVTSIGGYVNWTNFSDGRYKKNVKENVPGLAFINQLRPVTYTLAITEVNGILHKEGNKVSVDQKEKAVYTGFIAQEVEESAQKLKFDFSGVVKPQNENDFYGLRYSDFVVPMVKAIQELSSTNDSLRSVIDSFSVVTADLQTQINNIYQELKKISTYHASILKQNAPNPFSNSTTISYYLPSNVSNAQLVITDGQGKVLQGVLLNNQEGLGKAIINSEKLASGVYYYSLLVNGQNIDTKKMVVAR